MKPGLNRKRSLKHRPPIVFIGFMGTGKSVLSRRLAGALGLKHWDCDAEIERREQRTIREIFAQDGESRFRQIESGVLRALLRKTDAVIAAGGGVVCRRANIRRLRKSAYVIWLRSRPSVIYQRTRKDRSRPLLNVAHPKRVIARLLRSREPLYRACSHRVIWTDRGLRPETILKRLSRAACAGSARKTEPA